MKYGGNTVFETDSFLMVLSICCVFVWRFTLVVYVEGSWELLPYTIENVLCVLVHVQMSIKATVMDFISISFKKIWKRLCF